MIPGAVRLHLLQRFLQLHARRRQEAGRNFLNRKRAHRSLELLLGSEFGGAVGAAGNVLLQFVACVVGQFVVQSKA